MLDTTPYLVNKAVVWKNPIPDGYGKYEFSDPVEYDCRWLDKQELYRDNNQTQKLSNAVVFFKKEVLPGEMIMKGSLSDLDSSSSSQYNDDAYEVKTTQEQKDVEGNIVWYKIVV